VAYYAITMSDSLIIAGVWTMLIIQTVLLWRCLNLHGKFDHFSEAMGTDSGIIKSSLVNVGDLLDEALDMGGELMSGPSPLQYTNQTTGESIPEMILGALMNRIKMSSEHGSQTEPEDRSDDEIDETQNEQIQGSGIGSSDIGDSS